MNYRLDKYNNKISLLGFGCMRFKNTLGKIDISKTEEQIMAAIRGGINYFDTAYVYPGSEAALGEILEKNDIRNEVYIATKLPHYLIKSLDGLEKLFQEQLRRLRTDHIDYYLMHMLSDISAWNRLKEFGIEQWLAEKKQAVPFVRSAFPTMAIPKCSAGYCMPCPKGVDIPGTFSAYNRRYCDSKFYGFVDYMVCTALRKNSTAASNCIECGKCESHCPQHIEIRKELKNAAKDMENPLYKIVRKGVAFFKVF